MYTCACTSDHRYFHTCIFYCLCNDVSYNFTCLLYFFDIVKVITDQSGYTLRNFVLFLFMHLFIDHPWLYSFNSKQVIIAIRHIARKY